MSSGLEAAVENSHKKLTTFAEINRLWAEYAAQQWLLEMRNSWFMGDRVQASEIKALAAIGMKVRLELFCPTFAPDEHWGWRAFFASCSPWLARRLKRTKKGERQFYYLKDSNTLICSVDNYKFLKEVLDEENLHVQRDGAIGRADGASEADPRCDAAAAEDHQQHDDVGDPDR